MSVGIDKLIKSSLPKCCHYCWYTVSVHPWQLKEVTQQKIDFWYKKSYKLLLNIKLTWKDTHDVASEVSTIQKFLTLLLTLNARLVCTRTKCTNENTVNIQQ